MPYRHPCRGVTYYARKAMTLRLHPDKDDSNLPETGKVLATLVAFCGSVTIDPATGELSINQDPDAPTGARAALQHLQGELNRFRCLSGTEADPRYHTYLPGVDGKPVLITSEIRGSTVEGARQRKALESFIGRVSGKSMVTFCKTDEGEHRTQHLLHLIQGFFDRLHIRLHDPS